MPDFDKYFQILRKYTKIPVKNIPLLHSTQLREKKILEWGKKFGGEKFLRRSESDFMYVFLGGGVCRVRQGLIWSRSGWALRGVTSCKIWAFCSVTWDKTG
jgi:hypothetical protein